MQVLIPQTATHPVPRLHLSFDVGHSSIGWAVLQTGAEQFPDLLGTGVVTFEADDCLAQKRRAFRRQRRHVRATRQRVARMEKLLAHLGALTAEQLAAKHRQAGGDNAPWLLAANVLSDGGLLSWEQLWDVLRWYAHNRGYDGNRRWANNGDLPPDEQTDDAKADSEKVQNARELMREFGTQTFAETFTRALGLEPGGPKKSSQVRFKAKNAAFPRDTVETEVRRILKAHRDKLPRLDDAFINLLLAPTLTKEQRDDLAAAGIPLPKRFAGGLLFGQSVPRFDNRILSACPISGEKVPARHCPEFFRFRWAMQLANIRVGGDDGALRPLNPEERHALDAIARAEGRLTKGDFKKNVRALPGVTRDNLDQLLLHPNIEKALVLDPVTALIATNEYLSKIWPALAPRVQKRARDILARFKPLTIAALLEISRKLNEPAAAIETAVTALLDAANTRKSKKEVLLPLEGVDAPAPETKPRKNSKKSAGLLTRDTLLKETFSIKKESGRAAYARPLLVRAAAEVMAGKDPKAKGGCLEETDAVKQRRLARPLDQQTNNHLVRHRLLILGRLLRDLVAAPEFANGDKSRVARLTIEVNRDLREFSGMTNKEIETDLNSRLRNFGSVSRKLEADLAGTGIPITAGLIRKARIADDLGWQCPYTGIGFDAVTLARRGVDKDHIIPRSLRPSDSLDSLVITFPGVNKWKGARTAQQFIQDEQGKTVPDAPNLSIRPLREYEQWVDALESFKGHDDDKRRKKRRKELLRLATYAEKSGDFLPKDLTQTSQLVRLGAQLLEKFFHDLPAGQRPQIISIPGSVTAEVRKAWKLTACLALAAPDVLDRDGHVKTKDEIRGITHLHHALDACVLAYASALLPRDGGLWEIMVKRHKNDADRARLRATGLFDFNANGFSDLRDLPAETKEQIRQKLAEKRVVQHIPKDCGGLRVEENTRGVERLETDADGKTTVHLRQRARDMKTGAISIKRTEEVPGKTVGLAPVDGRGKLRPQKGVRVITDNFGVAILDHAPEGAEKFAIIPWHKVWWRLGELKKQNANKPPKLLRSGMLVHVPNKAGRSDYRGLWMVRGVQLNQRAGILVNVCFPDIINCNQSGYKDRKMNISLETLIQGGLEIQAPTLVGIPFPKEYLEFQGLIKKPAKEQTAPAPVPSVP